MKHVATIDLRALAAISHATSKEETRYYLQGVCLEITKDHVTYVATDGHILAATRRVLEPGKDYVDGYGLLEGRFVIPTAICNHFKLAKRDVATLAVLEWTEGLSLTLRYAGQAITFEAIDGTFPDWQRVVPSEFTGECAQFNPMLLARFSKISKALGGGELVRLLHNGNGPALVNFGNIEHVEDIFGCIMPMRALSEIRLPHWVKAPATAPEELMAAE